MNFDLLHAVLYEEHLTDEAQDKFHQLDGGRGRLQEPQLDARAAPA
jgi:hypothetical protein